MPGSSPNHYEVLGVMADATTGQIRAAYRDKAKVAHPDAGGDPAGFRRLLEAYKTLADPNRRREYDDAHGINITHASGGGASTQGWTGRRGDFSGNVEFPAYLRDIVDAPWESSRQEERARAERAERDPLRNPLPADVVWWWPDTATTRPVLAGPMLLTTNASSIVALGALTGQEAWRSPLPARPVGSSVALDDAAFVATDDGALHRLDLGSGAPTWSVALGAPGRGGVVGIGNLVVASRADGRLVGIDGRTGRSVWTTKLAAPATTRLAVAEAEGAVVALTARSLELVDARRGRHRWRVPLRAPIELPPAAVGTTIWVAGGGGSGSLVRFDGATGAVRGTSRTGSVVVGMRPDPASDTLLASVAGPPRLVGLADDGRLHLSVDLPVVCPEPALVDDQAFLADPSGRILVVDRLRRAVVAAATVPFEVIGAPIAVGDRLVLTASDGRLWATEQPREPAPS